MAKCKFIVIDGIDGSGKTTLCEHIAKTAIQLGYSEDSVVVIKALGGGLVGSAIRSRVLQKNGVTKAQQNVYMATALVDTFGYHIPELLKTKKLIIVDRYISSYFAYQLTDKRLAMTASLAANIYFDLLNTLVQPDLFIYTEVSAARSINNLAKRSKSGDTLDVFDNLELDEKNKIIDKFDYFFNSFKNTKFKTKKDCEVEELKLSVSLLLRRWLSNEGRKVTKEDIKTAEAYRF